ncbi:MAG: hypothetical protein ACLTE2_07865 [Eubacteriales bacterium]
MPVRQTLVRILKSYLEDVREQNTFDRHIVKEPWQERIKETAISFWMITKNGF